jgi:hypothetical protein
MGNEDYSPGSRTIAPIPNGTTPNSASSSSSPKKRKFSESKKSESTSCGSTSSVSEVEMMFNSDSHLDEYLEKSYHVFKVRYNCFFVVIEYSHVISSQVPLLFNHL